ncbi:tryptophan--tRNA ligase [Tumebacillus flagellatus]|uniref:Tryptophan--tRNA ligase n=1 Tax=Tumebacillus flagellatus TaxID=1157490 RepID=A0A074LKR2_9BACL|nr:tryptophan--tRNA ligase [Tumebacillus flagellatus]KEO81689.1 tryptophanyl-tRNA synthetase [Tumebacillus flagellatus]
MTNKILVSGIRSTGELHLGNYYGAMMDLVNYQNEYDAYFFIADLHSLTTHPNNPDLRKNVLNVAGNYLAAGLDPDKCALYAQSSIAAEVSELAMYLGMMMPLGELLRCPTFKEKAKKHPDNVNYGLVGYPVLMAADILIHRGEFVPVGDDQMVHLEMARTIVRKFRQTYGLDLFPEPLGMTKNAVRIPSLTGNGKMSKSDAADTYISMTDPQDLIEKKVKKAFSDPERVYKHQPGHPTAEGCNIFHMHTYFTDEQTRAQLETQCLSAEIGCVQCKARLAESMKEIVNPFRERREKLTEQYILDVLTDGQKRAKESAQRTIAEVRKAVGIITV